MHKKFEINGTKIKGGCQLGTKVVIHNSKSDLPTSIYIIAVSTYIPKYLYFWISVIQRSWDVRDYLLCIFLYFKIGHNSVRIEVQISIGRK